ncbi:MAG: hypothetical protein Q8Q90_00175 [bacterium]|nr:hypothetical protein [bacterium]
MNKKVTKNPYPGVLETTVITLTEEEEREVFKPYTDAVRKVTEEYKRKERQAIAENRRRRGLPPLIY